MFWTLTLTNSHWNSSISSTSLKFCLIQDRTFQNLNNLHKQKNITMQTFRLLILAIFCHYTTSFNDNNQLWILGSSIYLLRSCRFVFLENMQLNCNVFQRSHFGHHSELYLTKNAPQNLDIFNNLNLCRPNICRFQISIFSTFKLFFGFE